MSILTSENLGLSFGAFDVFQGLNLSVANDGKIGLIGPNGIGKTSLMLILAGLNSPTAGSVHIARGRRLGYLRQEAVDAFADRSHSVYGEMLTVFSGLQAMQSKLNEMELAMANGDHSPDSLQNYGNLLERFQIAGGFDFDQRIHQTLDGLGLGKKTWDMPLNHLSGGQKTRALLARLLLEKPDLLMLDEPTNHLDIEAVEWLEHILTAWEGAVLVVSHDRFFLDNTINTVWEMEKNGIEVYHGNYSAYLQQRRDRWEAVDRAYKEEKARLTREMDFVQRNWVRASSHARALGVLKKVTRDLAVIDRYGLMALRSGKQWSEFGINGGRPLDVIEAIRKVNAIENPAIRPPENRPYLPAAPAGGNIALRARQVAVGYKSHILFKSVESELQRGECAALIGPNGSGKTTFLKVLLGELKPLAGEVYLGPSQKVGYFAQAHDALTANHSVMDEIQTHKPMLPEQAHSHLARYLFCDEDVHKPVAKLSGGERARLALAILALEGTNLLLLDEPTNHLDIPAREALQEMLEKYPGTILLVSHDRYLINRLATQIWDIHDGKLEVFKGNYREYILRKKSTNGIRQTILSERPQARDNSRETRRRTQNLDLLEGRIREQERKIQALSSNLQKAAQAESFVQLNQLSTQLAQAQALLENLMEEWEKAIVS